MTCAHGLASGPAPHCHISIGSRVEAVKIGHPAEIADRTLSVKLRKAYTALVPNTTMKLGKFCASGRAPSDATLRRSRISACYETTSCRSWSSTKGV